mmetsp:Transcript_24369/g.50579  ORF Transcript_24369/g.50579 Transcript_24369/m.50579 type:complete len:185 (+) Transcript_24369:127-681(+)|eukprot:CAMPEP_0171341566 /NCGR_PEP_ID=MMETSP0878-20121228/10841_1 /TAXON_ID=67004 /ORGANISM="Thalassiosira weissflogii, Strain CCMP1336" /LENGTH=184 /DNA_ID=CAMNT_0011843875 /DNA_START=52 /DNA_END=606 /DNA_ORIENTATION=-
MVDQTPLISREEQITGPKLGHSCCGCCCDTRRAVILVQIVFQIILGTVSAILYSEGDFYDDWSNNPRVTKDLEDAYRKLAIVAGVGAGVGLLVIFGAVTYKAPLIYLGIVMILVENALSIAFLWPAIQDQQEKTGGAIWVSLIGPIVWMLVLVYPHIVFASEIKRGIMSPETYDREKQCGCCNV